MTEKDIRHEVVNKKEVLEKITPVIESAAIKLNLIPLEIDFIKESCRWFLRIFIFSPDHAITHDDCGDMTRSLNDCLNGLIPVIYYLEISSPGADRTLKSPKEYELFKGKTIKIKLRQPLEKGGERVFMAKIVDYQHNGILRVKLTTNKEELEIENSNISSIRLCLE